MTGQEFSELLKLAIQVAQIIALIYAGYKFSRKPHDTLEAQHKALEKRVDEHDLKFKEIDSSLHQGNDRFRRQLDLNEVFINCMLAFIDFEMAYCSKTGYEDISDLQTAKATLRKYLAKG